jgi:hypothetical protein
VSTQIHEETVWHPRGPIFQLNYHMRFSFPRKIVFSIIRSIKEIDFIPKGDIFRMYYWLSILLLIDYSKKSKQTNWWRINEQDRLISLCVIKLWVMPIFKNPWPLGSFKSTKILRTFCQKEFGEWFIDKIKSIRATTKKSLWTIWHSNIPEINWSSFLRYEDIYDWLSILIAYACHHFFFFFYAYP